MAYGFTRLDPDGADPARVVRVDRGLVIVATAAGTATADPYSLASRRHGTEGSPVTGDWVAVADDPTGHLAVVAVLPRWSTIVRKADEERSPEAQVLAADVDLVGLVVPLDRPVPANRLERSLALAWESGARPLVLLTKADAAADPGGAVAAARAVSGGVDVLATSSTTGEGIGELRHRVATGGTLVLLGPSGAGKSTLVNLLVGEEVQATGDVRPSDLRGRHTTVTRELVPVPTGGVLLDTPGIRGLGLWDADEGVGRAFADIDELATGCRFSDCRHDGEPGCAVAAAIAGGDLSARRYASYRKLRDEMAAFDARRIESARRAGGRPPGGRGRRGPGRSRPGR